METIQAVGILVVSAIALVVITIGIRNQWRIYRQDQKFLRRERELEHAFKA